jgi:hypothetical protein
MRLMDLRTIFIIDSAVSTQRTDISKCNKIQQNDIHLRMTN